MANTQIQEKIHDVLVLKNGYFNHSNDLVDVSDGSYDYIHLVIVSRQFDDQRVKERQPTTQAPDYSPNGKSNTRAP